uniref:KAP NTPase domain-containing protein n=1 Tax=Glossina brevipalpis TaxID=37001 RepID=A0A1A9WT34_9MUSC
MSEKRRRYRKSKDEKRSSALAATFKELDIQPKILLKTKNELKTENDWSGSSANVELANPVTVQVPQKTIIFTKNSQSPAMSPNTIKEQTNNNSNDGSQQTQVIEPVPQMTRPATVISSIGLIIDSAKKLLMKNNSDFMVVGVVGTQGVGKSTILNLLANEQPDFDYYRKVFVEEDSIFPTKLKLNRCSARSRTESTHMFITSDRLILLDTPPVLSNAYKKDMTNNELDDLTNIITLLSASHLLIVVMDDYFNLNFLNLLRFAELMKPSQDVKPFLHNYFPNVLFVKNHAKRSDFAQANKTILENILKSLFKDSQLRIYRGQSMDYIQQDGRALMSKQRKARTADVERPVNVFLLPDIKSEEATCYHESLSNIVEQLRCLVFSTPRNQMYVGATDLTEEIWFEWLGKVSQSVDHFFFKTYEDIQRKYLDAAPSAKDNATNNAKDQLESWRD